MEGFTWCAESFEQSVSSRCWWYTPYDLGSERWEKCPQLRQDAELRACVEMESALGKLPEWAVLIVERAICHVAPCGHHTFPLPYLEVADAIGQQRPPATIHSCFRVTQARKRAYQDYILCLDGWLAGAAPEAIAKELNAPGSRKIDWSIVCRELWRVLDERTEAKELLVERLLLQLRLYVKETVAENDAGTVFGRDQYLGDYAPSPMQATQAPDTSHIRAKFDLAASPRVRRIDERLAQICPHIKFFRHLMFDNAWPCGPKSFRYLERLVWAIGTQRPFRLPSHREYPPVEVPTFLSVQDTYPDMNEAAKWWVEFCAALDGYVGGAMPGGVVADDIERRLGVTNPAKQWLVRLYRHKLRLLESHAELGRLVHPAPGRTPGRQSLGVTLR